MTTRVYHLLKNLNLLFILHLQLRYPKQNIDLIHYIQGNMSINIRVLSSFFYFRCTTIYENLFYHETDYPY